MAGKLRSLAPWLWSPCNGAEFMQTPCFFIRKRGFLVCVHLQVLGQKSQVNDSNLTYLPYPRPHLESSLAEHKWATLKLLTKTAWCLLTVRLGKTSHTPRRGQNSSLWGPHIWKVNVAWNGRGRLPRKGRRTSSRPPPLKGRYRAGLPWKYKDTQRNAS